MSTGFSPRLKRPEHGADHPSPSSVEVKERADLYLYPPVGLLDLFYGETYLYLTLLWLQMLCSNI